MRRLLITVLVGLWTLVGASAALAQCGTSIPGGTVCGNPAGSQGLNNPVIHPVLGIPGSTQGTLGLASPSGGTATFFPPAISGNVAITAPSVSGILALLNSPAFTGVPTAPTAAPGTNTAQLATTAFVASAISGDCTVLGAFLVGTGSGLQCSTTAGSSALLNGTMTLNPATGTTTKGLVITQTAPSSGTPTGPILFNQIDVTNPGLGASGGGHDNFGGQNLIYGTRFTMSVTGASSGAGSSAFGAFTNIAAASDGFGGSHGVTISGLNPAGHNAWGHIGYGIVFNPGSIGLLVGVEGEMGVSAGATVAQRVGVSANSQGPVQGSALDAAFAANTINIAGYGGNAAPWQHLMALAGNMYSGIGFPLAATGDFFFSDTAGTVANVMNLGNVTVTGNILKFPNLVVPGAPSGFTLPGVTAGTVLQFGGQSGGVTSIEVDSFGGNPKFIGRRADGTSIAPTAVQSGELISTLAANGYDGAAYHEIGGGGVFAAQNFTVGNQGTYYSVFTTPLNSATEGEVVRIQQGLMVGTTTDPGAGIINLLTGLRINNAATNGNVLRGNGTNFVSAQLSCSDLSGVGTGCSGTSFSNLTGAVTSVGAATSLGSFTSANLSGALTDETGTGVAVFGTSPTLATPVINGLATGTGVATANTASTLVARDGSGNFSAGTITANLTGHASQDLSLAGGTLSGVGGINMTFTSLTNASSVGLAGSGSGTTTLMAPATGGGTATFPAGSGTLAYTSTANVATVSNSDGTLTISPTNGAVVASLALSHVNTWTGAQTFSGGIAMGGSNITGGGTIAGTAITASTSVSTPIYTSAGSHTFQSNGSTFAGLINTNQQWYLGTTSLTPASGTTLTVSQNTGGTPGTSALGNIIGQFIAADAALGILTLDIFGAQGVFSPRYAGGTQASKTAAPVNTVVFGFGPQGWDGVSAYGNLASIDFATVNQTSATDHSGSVRVRTVASGSTTLAEAIRIQGSGGVSIGTTTDPGTGSLQLNAQMFMPNITTSSAAQTGTVCWTTGTGKFTVDTTLGCLTSIMAAKNITERLAPSKALDIVSRLDPFAFRYKPGYGDSGHYEQFGFGAEEVMLVDERLVGRDPEGTLSGVRYQEMTAVLAGAIQKLKADNDNMRTEIENLKRTRR